MVSIRDLPCAVFQGIFMKCVQPLNIVHNFKLDVNCFIGAPENRKDGDFAAHATGRRIGLTEPGNSFILQQQGAMP
jgi:hypothetical protein